MDPQTFLDIATTVTKLKMYPYFDIAHFMLMCMAVRDDIPQGAVAPGRLHYSKFTSKNNFNFKYRDLPLTTKFVYCFWAIHWRRLFTVNGKTIPRFNSYYYKLQFTSNANGNACSFCSQRGLQIGPIQRMGAAPGVIHTRRFFVLIP